jgi:hypothetical protein
MHAATAPTLTGCVVAHAAAWDHGWGARRAEERHYPTPGEKRGHVKAFWWWGAVRRMLLRVSGAVEFVPVWLALLIQKARTHTLHSGTHHTTAHTRVVPLLALQPPRRHHRVHEAWVQCLGDGNVDSTFDKRGTSKLLHLQTPSMGSNTARARVPSSHFHTIYQEFITIKAILL